jgi:hypothetical protein
MVVATIIIIVCIQPSIGAYFDEESFEESADARTTRRNLAAKLPSS